MWELLGAAIGAVFGAGVAWGAMRSQVIRARNDLNGVRRIFNDHVEAEQAELKRITLAVLLVTPEAKREELIAKFWPK